MKKFIERVNNKLQFLTIPLKIAIKRKQNFKEEGLGSYRQTIANLNSPNSKFIWDIVNDHQYGGKSNGNIEFDKESKALIFNGDIIEDKDGLMQKNPYISFVYNFPINLNLRFLNRLKIEAQTDGSIYKVQLLVTSNFSLNHYIYVHLNSFYYQFRDIQLIKQNNGEIMRFQYKTAQQKKSITINKKQQLKRVKNYMESMTLKEIKIIKEVKKSQTFSFKMKNIELGYNVDEYSQLADEIYSSPYFFDENLLQKKQIIFTGREDKYLKLFEKEEKKMKFMNNFYQ